MNVLHINSYYAVSEFYSQLYQQQVNQGLNIRVFMPYEIGKKLCLDVYPAYCQQVPCFHPLDRAIFAVKSRKIWNACMREYQSFRAYDLVHAHSLFANGVIANRIWQKDGIPYVVAVRDTDVNVFFRHMSHLRSLGRRILREAARVVFISPAYREEALRPYLDPAEYEAVLQKSVALPNGVSEMWLANRAEAHALAEGAVRFLFVGKLTLKKNVSAAIEAVEILRRGGMSATLTVVGKAKNKKEFGKVSACACAEYLGTLSPEALLKVYREHDVFLLPSKTETFGIVYAEALTQGLPVLYTKGQGFDGQFEDGKVGRAIDASNPNDIAEKAKWVLEKYDELAPRCLDECVRFDWERIAMEYGLLYTDVLDNPKILLQ